MSNQKVCGKGTARIPPIDKIGQLVNLSLEKALYVPTFHFNSLSVDNLVSAGNKVTFEPSESQFSSKDNILELFREEKLFYLQESIPQSAKFSLISLGQCTVALVT